MNFKRNFLILSEDKVVIDAKINNILSNIKDHDSQLIKYDLEMTSLYNVIEELDTYDFLSNCKIVVCYNCSFLEGASNDDIKYLDKYLNNPSNNYLILVASKLSEKKEIKKLLVNMEIVDSKFSSEILIKSRLNNFSMDNKTIKYFAEYCLYNNEKIINELDKIKLYKIDEENKNISINDINMLVAKDYDENVFDLVNAIAKRDNNKIFEIYYRIVKSEKDIVGLLAGISSQLRLLYCVKLLNDDRISVNEISKMLNVKFRAVTIALENCCNFSYRKLIMLLNDLSDLDYKIKSSDISSSLAFEMFLLKI